MQIYLIALFGGIFVYLVIYIIFSSSGKEKERIRIARYFKENNADDVQEQFIRERNEEEQKNKKQRYKIVSKEFSNYIASSGLKLTAAEFIYFWLGFTLLPMILIVFMGGNVITASALGVVGFAIPPILVNKARKKREELFNKQLGEALIIIGNSLKGGFTFLQGMESISIDMQPPISKEFAKVLREIHYGVKQLDAIIEKEDKFAYVIAKAKYFYQWDGEALPFINLDDNYLVGENIILWEKLLESSGDFESLWKDEIFIMNSDDDDSIYIDVNYSDGLTITKGVVASIKGAVEKIVNQNKPVYILSLSNDVINAEKYVDLSNKLTINYGDFVLLKANIITFEPNGNQQKIELEVLDIYDIGNNEFPKDYSNAEAARIVSSLIE